MATQLSQQSSQWLFSYVPSLGPPTGPPVITGEVSGSSEVEFRSADPFSSFEPCVGSSGIIPPSSIFNHSGGVIHGEYLNEIMGELNRVLECAG